MRTYGTSGNDTLSGGALEDISNAGEGHNLINAGEGNNQVKPCSETAHKINTKRPGPTEAKQIEYAVWNAACQ